MGILSRIFARPEDGSKIVDGAIKTLDSAFFTKQERADYSQQVSDWYLKWLAASSGATLARRVIAVMVVSLWTVLILAGVIAFLFKLTEFSEFVFKVLTEAVMMPFSIIIGFYFLTHTVRAFQKPKKEK